MKLNAVATAIVLSLAVFCVAFKDEIPHVAHPSIEDMELSNEKYLLLAKGQLATRLTAELAAAIENKAPRSTHPSIDDVEPADEEFLRLAKAQLSQFAEIAAAIKTEAPNSTHPPVDDMELSDEEYRHLVKAHLARIIESVTTLMIKMDAGNHMVATPHVMAHGVVSDWSEYSDLPSYLGDPNPRDSGPRSEEDLRWDDHWKGVQCVVVVISVALSAYLGVILGICTKRQWGFVVAARQAEKAEKAEKVRQARFPQMSLAT
ncbi:hypothetical protein K505DRAFT_331851 [Melanomma pulvis-pyrius CBS 109.77]|uniref:Uncharacterized protein n=1 Tax=Melanomma pulvis-pyrius CBS 109.77 TaxID=1314802 RepID=A0A6A6XV11_9PLEO|nr:hypothetical protein K505DRAFT_331851 [Melanomma pulvis-pyrius CBS 109.77]